MMYKLIYSHTGGHLGCFQIWAIMNKVDVSIKYKFLHKHKLSNPLSKYQGMQLLDHMVIVCLLS